MGGGLALHIFVRWDQSHAHFKTSYSPLLRQDPTGCLTQCSMNPEACQSLVTTGLVPLTLSDDSFSGLFTPRPDQHSTEYWRGVHLISRDLSLHSSHLSSPLPWTVSSISSIQGAHWFLPGLWPANLPGSKLGLSLGSPLICHLSVITDHYYLISNCKQISSVCFAHLQVFCKCKSKLVSVTPSWLEAEVPWAV